MKDQIRKLRNQKLTLQQIADKLHVSRNCIASLVRKHEIHIRKCKPPKIDLDRLRELHSQDMQNYLIARELGCSESYIESWNQRLGLKKSRTGPKSGPRHPDWRGGRIKIKGYIFVYSPDHPNKVYGNYVSEHRLAMEKTLGRLLSRSEVVHHKDGDPTNNHPDNLVLYSSNGEHLREHFFGNLEHGQRISEGMSKSLKWKSIQRRSKSGGPSASSQKTRPPS